MQGKEYIFFDLDGTLTDPGLGITNSVMYALKYYGIDEDRDNLYRFIGPPLVDSFREFYGFSDEKAWEALEKYREYFGEKGIFENEVYDGIADLLTCVKKSGKKIFLATSKPEEYAIRILEHFDLLKYFDFVGGSTMDESRSKKADVIRYILESNKINDVSKIIMVGDRLHDILGARECGIESIGVLFGFGSREELENAGANYIVGDVESLKSYLIG